MPAPVVHEASGMRDRPVEELAVRVAEMGRSLDFYLDLGCEVRSAADGWALLCCGPVSFVLIQVTAVVRPRTRLLARRSATAPPLVRLPTSNVRAVRRRLLAAGVPAGTIIRPPHAPAGEIEVSDPDQHIIVLAQAGPPCRTG